MTDGFDVRPAGPEDAAAIAGILGSAFGPLAGAFPAEAATSPAQIERSLQTGTVMLISLYRGVPAGVATWSEEEGTARVGTIASTRPGAAVRLVRAIEREAQDRGLRHVRMRLPDDWRTTALAGRWGYLGVARAEGADGSPLLEVERRLPLLTVREQRIADAGRIAELTGLDPWPFEQRRRPGWFVAADGERVVGVAGVAGQDGAIAAVSEPWLEPRYRGRGLEVWMCERAAAWAATNGCMEAHLAASPALEPLEREFEDQGWFREDDAGDYVKRLGLRALPTRGEWLDQIRGQDADDD